MFYSFACSFQMPQAGGGRQRGRSNSIARGLSNSTGISQELVKLHYEAGDILQRVKTTISVRPTRPRAGLTSFLGAAALARLVALGVLFFRLAPLFEGAFSDATCAPCFRNCG
jgi:hypothetical protein